jgi:hypothetical protein
MTQLRAMPELDWPVEELYSAYQAAREDVEQALAHWRAARRPQKRDGFAIYRAAADREDAAALAWMRSCAAYDAAAAGGA